MQQSYPTSLVPSVPLTDAAASELVSAVILPYSRRVLADASHRTTEAAKRWKEADSAPSLASAINLARQIPEVKWLIHILMEEGELTLDSTEVQTKLRQTLSRLASKNDASALHARQALQQLFRLNAGTEASAHNPGPLHASEKVSSPPDATIPLETGGSQLSRASCSFSDERRR